jgi:hypothetical protein
MKGGAAAPHWAAYGLRMRNTSGPFGGASLAGVPFLTDHLGPDARMVVEIAWGADPNGNADLWSWTDITDYVAQDPGESWQYGRMSEASDTQPASGSMLLFNDDASFSLGGISPNWPNVKQGVPVRVRIDPNGTGFRIAFQGNIASLTPGWDTTGDIATMQIELAGTLQRLTQGDGKAPRSAPLRYVTVQADPQPDIYYPLNEGPLADRGLPFEPGPAEAELDLTFLDAPPTATVKIFGAGELAPWLPNGVHLANSSTLRCHTQGTTPGVVIDSFTLDCLVTFSGNNPEAGDVGLAIEVYAGINNVGTRLYHAVWFYPFERTVSVRNVNTGADFDTFDADFTERLYDGDPHHVRIHVYQDGADTRTVFSLDNVFFAGALNGVGITLAYPPYFSFWSDTKDGVAVGHAAFWTGEDGTEPSVAEVAYHYLGAAGDSAIDRMQRLSEVDNIPLEILGDTGSDDDTAGDMGPQPNEQVVPLLRECEAADRGILFDGLGPGFTYVAREIIENGEAVLTIDVAAAELDPMFSPVHNDERLINKMTARRTLGGEYTYEDTDGPRGTASVGVYDDGMDVNISAGSRIEDFASWAVHLGTSEGYRYPSVSVNLSAVPHLAPAILSVRPGTRLNLTGVGQVLRGHSEDDVSLVVEGISMSVSTFTWIVTFQCSRFDLWRIIVLAATSGDTSDYLCYLETDGSHLQDGVPEGATSLTVSTPSGPLWTTDADDFPFDVMVGGTQVTVTNVTGASSPQTFTVDAMPLAKPGNSPIEIWQPPVQRL